MSITLNHTTVWCRDKDVSARYLTDILGLDEPRRWGPFLVVEPVRAAALRRLRQAGREVALETAPVEQRRPMQVSKIGRSMPVRL